MEIVPEICHDNWANVCEVILKIGVQFESRNPSVRDDIRNINFLLTNVNLLDSEIRSRFRKAGAKCLRSESERSKLRQHFNMRKASSCQVGSDGGDYFYTLLVKQ